MDANFTGVHSPEELKVIWESDSATAFNEYLALQEESETPREYLIWSLIAFAAGLLGRNASLVFGPSLTIRPNIMVILLGPSRMRKSTAINMTRKLVETTSLNYAPTDTGGQRHGIMSALTGMNRVMGTKSHYPDMGPLNRSMLHPRRSDDMMVVSTELGVLFGQGSVDMMNFFNELYDGEGIDYQTKAGETRLATPLISLLAATTPQNLAGILPASATGHGILGRTIFVYADKIHKRVPIPPEVGEEWYEARQKIIDRLQWIDTNRIDFSVSAKARSEYQRLYEYIPAIDEPRLETYKDGRSTILMKVSMCVAALRGDTQVLESDVLLSHELLHAIEPKMEKALEFFGRNKAYTGRMLIIQYIRQHPLGQATRLEAIAAATSELSQREAEEALQNMLASGEVVMIGGTHLVLGEIRNQFKTTAANSTRTRTNTNR